MRRIILHQRFFDLGRIPKRMIVRLVAVCLAFGVSGCNRDPAETRLVVVTAPMWIPAALIACVAGGCNAANEVEQKVSPEVRAAADNGDRQAQYELGHAFDANSQYALAAVWYRKAAEQGYGEAQARLGILCECGNGVEKDYVQADMWYLIASKSANTTSETAARAIQGSNDLEKRMTPEQIAVARWRVQEWKPTPSGASTQAQPAN